MKRANECDCAVLWPPGERDAGSRDGPQCTCGPGLVPKPESKGQWSTTHTTIRHQHYIHVII